MTKKAGLVGILLVAIFSPFLIVFILWLTILLSPNPFDHVLAKSTPWPIACSLRGCISTTAWQKQYQARQLFAKTVGQNQPTPVDALTTLIRQHLVAESFARPPFTKKDAQRYREEILQAKDETKILGSTGLTFNDYDKLVILPLLEQEALRKERKVEHFDELFKHLANERTVWVLPMSLKWNKADAKVTQ